MAKQELVDHAERRAHPRYVVNIQVDLCMGTEIVSGLMVDISIEGMRISLPKLVKPSTDMMVIFSTDEEVNILSQVVWVLEKMSAGLPSYLAGLKIDSFLVNNDDLPGMAERTAFLDKLLQ